MVWIKKEIEKIPELIKNASEKNFLANCQRRKWHFSGSIFFLFFSLPKLHQANEPQLDHSCSEITGDFSCVFPPVVPMAAVFGCEPSILFSLTSFAVCHFWMQRFPTSSN